MRDKHRPLSTSEAILKNTLSEVRVASGSQIWTAYAGGPFYRPNHVTSPQTGLNRLNKGDIIENNVIGLERPRDLTSLNKIPSTPMGIPF